LPCVSNFSVALSGLSCISKPHLEIEAASISRSLLPIIYALDPT
jgi:hypothetical protein